MIVHGMVSPMKNWQISSLKLCAVIGAGLLLSACSSLQSQEPEIIPDNELSTNTNTDSTTSYPVPSYDNSVDSGASSRVDATGKYYVVQHGDTIYSIATRYGRNYKDIASWNRLKAPYTLKQGQRLIVSTATTATPSAVDYSSTASSNKPIVTPSTGAYQGTSAQDGYHTAQSGDTVYNIARRYQLSPHNIIAINALTPPYHLVVGQVVRLGTNVPAVASNYVPAPVAKVQAISQGKQHMVRAGETLYSIARRYNYTADEVAAWNQLPPPYTLGVGQVLLIAQPSSHTTHATKKATVKTKPHVVAKSSKHSAAVQVVSEPVSSPAATPAKTVKPSRGMITPSGSGRAVASFHTVQNGETLESIAAAYHITTHDLAIWNGIGKPYTVLPGKKLLIVPP